MALAESGMPVELDVNFIVLERADASLTQLLLKRHQIQWSDRLTLFRNAVKGVHQMHNRYVVHRDLKSENFLVTRNGSLVRAKVSDLGRSRNTRDPSPVPASAYEVGRGDLRFAPPEFLWGLGTDNPEEMRLADLFLLGSVLFEFATGQGLTGIVFGDPRGILMTKKELSRDVRVRDYRHSQSRISRDLETAYELFAEELEKPIRAEAVALLRRLTAVEPQDREPGHIARRASNWDLQWLLKQVDRLSLRLRIAERGHARFPWKEDRKHGASTR